MKNSLTDYRENKEDCQNMAIFNNMNMATILVGVGGKGRLEGNMDPT